MEAVVAPLFRQMEQTEAKLEKKFEAFEKKLDAINAKLIMAECNAARQASFFDSWQRLLQRPRQWRVRHARCSLRTSKRKKRG